MMELDTFFLPHPPILHDVFIPLFQYQNPNSSVFSMMNIFNDSINKNWTFHSNLNFTAKASAPFSKTIAIRIFVGVVEFLVFAVGTPANCLVLYLTYEIFRRRARNQAGDGGGSRFQNGQLFVLTMASFDLLFCLVHAPLMFFMLVLIEQLPLSFTACIVMYFVTHTSTTGSSLSLLALNVEKFIRLYKPLHYRSIVTRTRTVVACALVWIISISWGAFLMFGPFMTNTQTPKGQCSQTLRHKGVYVFFAAQFFVLPTLASLAISGFTLLAALKIRRQKRAPVMVGVKRSHEICQQNGRGKNSQKKQNAENGHQRSTRRSPPEDISRKRKEQGEAKKNSCLSLMAFAGFVFTTTIWTSATILPYRIGYLWTVMHPYFNYDMVVCMFVLLALMVLNSAGNPFITVITKRQYSKRVRKILNGEGLSWKRRTTMENSAGGGSGGGAGADVKMVISPERMKLHESERNGFWWSDAHCRDTFA